MVEIISGSLVIVVHFKRPSAPVFLVAFATQRDDSESLGHGKIQAADR